MNDDLTATMNDDLTATMNDDLTAALRELAAAQRPLDADIAKILNDNLWNLYIRDEA